MKKLFIITFIVFIAITPFIAVQAAGFIPPCATDPGKEGDCGVCDFIYTASEISRWIFGIMGILALGFFIYAGFLWITSAGTMSKVEQGKKLMVQTIVGVIVIVLAWTIVNFVIANLAGYKDEEKGFLIDLNNSSVEWYNICNQNKK